MAQPFFLAAIGPRYCDAVEIRLIWSPPAAAFDRPHQFQLAPYGLILSDAFDR
ncbi:hypothetical protein ACVWY5_006728 [Bradyrhizobium sp. USDA 3256]